MFYLDDFRMFLSYLNELEMSYHVAGKPSKKLIYSENILY